MKPISEIMSSHRRFAILGGRTPAENAAYWAEKHKRGEGIVWPNGPQSGRATEELPDNCDLPTHLQRCSVPERLAAIICAGHRPTPAAEAVRHWLETDAAFLLLAGETGSGKTLAACTVFLSLRTTIRWDSGSQAQWLSHDGWCADAATLSRQSFYDAEGKQFVEYAKRVQLLVLDDLGAEVMSGPYASTLESILDSRFQNRTKRTVMTTNVSTARPSKDKPSAFEERYGARIARRIRESGAVVKCESAAPVAESARAGT